MKTILNSFAMTAAARGLCVLCLFVLYVTGCQSDINSAVAPAHMNAQKAAPKTELLFQVRDAGDGDAFNARLFGDIWYFPTTTTDEQIYTFFGDPRQNDDWNPKPSKPADTRYVLNQVSAGNYNANPGTFGKTVKAGYKIAIVWNFLDADRTARANYRHPLCIYYPTTAAQLKATIYTDRFRAGL